MRSTADLVPEYPAIAGNAIVAATEAILTMAPPAPALPPGRIARNACFMPRPVPTMLTSHILSLEIDDERGDLDAGIVDQDVVAAERGDGGCNRLFPLRVVGDVQFHEAGLGACFCKTAGS